MLVGVSLPNYGPLGSRDSITTIARRAENLGFSSLWVTDHVLMPKDYVVEPARAYEQLLEVLTTLSYLAAITSRVKLATSVLVLPLRDPRLLAKQAATVDHLSDGRLVLGVGLGWIEEEFAAMGVDYASRGKIADEYLQVIKELWTSSDDPIFAGDYVHFKDVVFSPRPGRARGIPVLIGGMSRHALRRAGRYGDGWHTMNVTPDDVVESAQVLFQHETDAGFEISLRITARVGRFDPPLPIPVLDGTPQDFRARVEEYAASGVENLVLDIPEATLEGFVSQMESIAEVLEL